MIMDMDRTRNHVVQTYERIASHFAATRSHPWPEVNEFLDSRPVLNRGLDIGCGNGRHLPPLSEVTTETIGLDLSRSLLEIAIERYANARTEVICGEAAHLPLQSETIDTCLYIATLHHLPQQSLRVRSLNEIDRVLTKRGAALISVWSITHDKFDEIDPGDHIIPWTLPSGETVDRYYHLYDEGTFEEEFEQSDLPVKETFESNGNWFAIAGADGGVIQA